MAPLLPSFSGFSFLYFTITFYFINIITALLLSLLSLDAV